MSFWQVTVLLAMAGCAMGCLVGILRAIQSLAKDLFSVSVELKKLNVKLERVEAVSADDPERSRNHEASDLEALEAIDAAISNFENLKRVDLTNPQQNDQ